jgi:hypothetical protein
LHHRQTGSEVGRKENLLGMSMAINGKGKPIHHGMEAGLTNLATLYCCSMTIIELIVMVM